MFSFKRRDPLATARDAYEACMRAATELQRKGDIRGFAAKSEEAARLEAKFAELEKQRKP